MIKYLTNPETKALEIIQEPTFVPEAIQRDVICIQPYPCPECGACLVCDLRCADSVASMRLQMP